MGLARGLAALAIFVGGLAAVAACADLSTLSSPDASAGDAAPPLDGAPPTDAAPASDGPWCATHPGHTHCFDFDQVGTPGVGWTGDVISGGSGAGAVSLDTTMASSAPASIKSSVANGSTGGGTYAVLFENISPYPSALTIAADILVDPATASAYTGAAGILGTQNVDQDSGTYYGVGLQLNGATPIVNVQYLNASGYAAQQIDAGALPAGWTRVELTMTLGRPLVVTLKYGSTVEVQRTIDGSLAIPDPALVVDVGIIGSGGGPLVAHYDNVTIDVTP